MFSRQPTMQIVSLDELARFINQVMPQQAGTTVTIYVQELHVHMAEQSIPLLNAGSYAALPATGIQVIDTPNSVWDYPPPAVRR